MDYESRSRKPESEQLRQVIVTTLRSTGGSCSAPKLLTVCLTILIPIVTATINNGCESAKTSLSPQRDLFCEILSRRL